MENDSILVHSNHLPPFFPPLQTYIPPEFSILGWEGLGATKDCTSKCLTENFYIVEYAGEREAFWILWALFCFSI